MSGRKASNREKLWKLGRRKVMEAFTMGRCGVRNENKAWRGLNRLFSDHWFSHKFLDFAQGLRNFSRVAKWVHTPSLISHSFLQSIFAKLGVRKFRMPCEIFVECAIWLSQGMQNFHTLCEMIFGIFASPTKFSQSVWNALFFWFFLR